MYYHQCNTVVGKREIENYVELHIFKAVYLPSLLYGMKNGSQWTSIAAESQQ